MSGEYDEELGELSNETGMTREEEDAQELTLLPAKRLAPGQHLGRTGEMILRLVDKTDHTGKATYVHLDVYPDETPSGRPLWFDAPLIASAGSMLGKVLINFGIKPEQFEEGTVKVTVKDVRQMLSNKVVKFETTYDNTPQKYTRLVKESLAPASAEQTTLEGAMGSSAPKAADTLERKLLSIINESMGGMVKHIDDLVTVLIDQRENKLIPKCQPLLDALTEQGALTNINGVYMTKAAQATGTVPVKGKKK